MSANAKKYESLKIEDFRLRSVDDIKKIYDLDPLNISGFNTLDDDNAKVYNEFILNFFNGWGLDARESLLPISIFFVKEVTYGKPTGDEDDYISCGEEIISIDKSGNEKVLKSFIPENVSDICSPQDEKKYLRFTFKQHGSKEWLHVLSSTDWY